jgi:hypothetical protein
VSKPLYQIRAEEKARVKARKPSIVEIDGKKYEIPPGTEMVYGEVYPIGAPKFPLELKCYRQRRGPEKGGLGTLRHFRQAWAYIWPDFEWNHWAHLIVEAWCGYQRISICGHGAAGKTYVLAHCVLLDWLAHPMETMTSLATVTAEGLKLRMWGDLMRAYESSKLSDVKAMTRAYSSSNRMNVIFDPTAAGATETHEFDKYIIEGTAVSRTKDAPGRIRGKHAPRRRVVLDEADDMPEVIYSCFSNIMTDPDWKIVDLSNATDRYSPFGKACEPEGGWGNVNPGDLFWRTAQGGICIHLDGLQNPNVKAWDPKTRKKKYAWMQGPEDQENIRRTFGEDSLEWWTQVRGFFPPDGVVGKVWPGSAIEKAKEPIIFDFEPKGCATLDPAFTHDDCVLHLGKMGKRRDGKTAISAEESIRIQIRQGSEFPPEDHQVAREVMKLCKEREVPPKNFIMDKTGNGRGVYAILQEEWSRDVIGINYWGEATERPMRYGQEEKANEVVVYFVSELWFRASFYAYQGHLGGLLRLDPKTIDDLNARRYSLREYTKGKRMVVETKDELKKRLGRSPDYGDSFSQFAELIIRSDGLGPSEAVVPQNQKWAQFRDKARKLNRLYGDTIEVQAW